MPDKDCIHYQVNKRLALVKLVLVNLPYLAKNYTYNVLRSMSCLLNAIAGGKGADQTFSARMGEAQVADKPVHSVAAKFVDFLFREFTGEVRHTLNAHLFPIEPKSISDLINQLREQNK